MSTRASGSLLFLIALVFAFNVGDFAAQDPAQSMRATQTTQTDLSGTYTGTFNCESAGLVGETTLTITGNQFTTSDGKSGRIVASTTGGYTAVALQIGESTPAATSGATATTGAAPPPQIISLRARKSGDRLTLMSVPGSMHRCTFMPTRATARGRRNRTPAATGTEVANPATSPTPATTPTETPMPEQTPSPSPSPTVSPSPEASPEPNPSPSPEPTEMPTPVPNPSPSPTASPTPTPSPSPSPVGQRR
jgi:hypothetical protein